MKSKRKRNLNSPSSSSTGSTSSSAAVSSSLSQTTSSSIDVELGVEIASYTQSSQVNDQTQESREGERLNSTSDLPSVAYSQSFPDSWLKKQGFQRQMFIQPIDAKYLCQLCSNYFCNPMQCPCGHRFCRECLIILSTDGHIRCESCIAENVTDGTEVFDFAACYPDKGLKREMASFNVSCPNDRCTWEGTLKMFENHHLGVCSYRMEVCECGLAMPYISLADHKASDCPMSTVHCSLCMSSMLKQDLTNHSCPYIKCLCGRRIARETLSVHQQNECVFRQNRCSVGCEETIPNMEQHMSDCVNLHIGMLGEKVESLTQLLSQFSGAGGDGISVIRNFDQRLQVLEQKNMQEVGLSDSANGRSASLESLALKVNTFGDIVSVIRLDQSKCNHAISSNHRRVESSEQQIIDLQEKLQSCTRDLESKTLRINLLETQLANQELLSYDGKLIWKISEFSKRKRDAVSGTCTSIYSRPFYSNKFGYRMCVRLYPNGDGMGKDKNVSLFFVVMRGQYDALLPWPFRQKVTFILLDQSGSEHVVDAFRPDPDSSSFKRPTSEMNVASGCPLFVSQDTLIKHASKYLRDDVMFIKVVVVPPSVDILNL